MRDRDPRGRDEIEQTGRRSADRVKLTATSRYGVVWGCPVVLPGQIHVEIRNGLDEWG